MERFRITHRRLHFDDKHIGLAGRIFLGWERRPSGHRPQWLKWVVKGVVQGGVASLRRDDESF
jgi:hypothetical protein